MSSTKMLGLTYQGEKLGDSTADFGRLRPSDDARDDPDVLRERMSEDGYLYMPGLLDKDEVMEARLEMMRRLADMGAVDESHSLSDGVYRPGGKTGGMYDFTLDNPPLMKVLYDGPMISFYDDFLGEPATHFDYTWFRVKTPGTSSPTNPHYDVVYMGRGSTRLFTSWTPLGDVPFEMGGLMVLEGSNHSEKLLGSYARTDVDKFCDEEDAAAVVARAKSEERELTSEERFRIRWNSTGSYSSSAQKTRNEIGGRWLTAEYELGDVLVFCIHIIHASSDNHTNRIRISSDSRYQPAADPRDERWIGEDPPAHGIRAKRGMIC